MVYGFLYYLIPDYLVKLSGGAPVFSGWLRWSGGVLIALGVGAILVIIKPKNQGIFVTTIALGCLLVDCQWYIHGLIRRRLTFVVYSLAGCCYPFDVGISLVGQACGKGYTVSP